MIEKNIIGGLKLWQEEKECPRVRKILLQEYDILSAAGYPGRP